MPSKTCEPRPITFPQANHVLSAPTELPDCGHLPCFRSATVQISCWEFPSLLDRLKFLCRGRLWFTFLSDRHPATGVSVDSPFDQGKL